MVFQPRGALGGRGRRPVDNVELMEEVRRLQAQLEAMEAGRQCDLEVGYVSDEEEEAPKEMIRLVFPCDANWISTNNV